MLSLLCPCLQVNGCPTGQHIRVHIQPKAEYAINAPCVGVAHAPARLYVNGPKAPSSTSVQCERNRYALVLVLPLIHSTGPDTLAHGNPSYCDTLVVLYRVLSSYAHREREYCWYHGCTVQLSPCNLPVSNCSWLLLTESYRKLRNVTGSYIYIQKLRKVSAFSYFRYHQQDVKPDVTFVRLSMRSDPAPCVL